MKRLIFILSAVSLLSGCKNTTENETSLKQIKVEDLNNKESYTNNANNKFFIKLNTIYGENGLEDYSKGSEEVFGEIVKQLNGSDGSEYYLLKLDKILEYTEREKKIPLKTSYLIIGGRTVEQPLRKGANKTLVNVAIVKDETVLTDELLDFSKAIFAGYGEATEVTK
ncbi:membrane lipoprotein lipid attachment site-containing protein [Flavobacterium saccharophilum]|uniref:Lipoprotein n=1 Tax=Flavobacterium saccharophilum TaxID=29534 RepID=A0A1M7HP47_9FLAO|nr:membrane lipoprotein lipid attachment site-containing protein [Flavobacterium saccharophilum]SHM30168.1 hypothetical protein SAMN05444366_2810 [Flavobacterium saccharophilum]